jgi:hypothetical protein
MSPILLSGICLYCKHEKRIRGNSHNTRFRELCTRGGIDQPIPRRALIVGVVATVAFTHPISARNGVVIDYSPGESVAIDSSSHLQTYSLRPGTVTLAFGGTSGIVDTGGSGASATATSAARVMVFAERLGDAFRKTSHGYSSRHEGLHDANPNPCIAPAVVVCGRAPPSSSFPATGGTTSAATPSTPVAVGRETPAVTTTPTP